MWSREEFSSALAPGIIGMIHLPALPGSPGWGGDFGFVEDTALRDAESLAAAGVQAIMVENYHDVPFLPSSVATETVAAMTRVIMACRLAFPRLSFGVNVLRNDANAALGIAVATGARFVRVNVHVGAAATDQGPIVGRAWETLRRRRDLGADTGDGYIAILADVRVKHARPVVERPLSEEALDLRLRGLADGIIVTGVATGAGADPAELQAVRTALPDCPLLVGSGMRAENVADFVPTADGCIVGSSLKVREPEADRELVSEQRTAAFVAAYRAALGR